MSLFFGSKIRNAQFTAPLCQSCPSVNPSSNYIGIYTKRPVSLPVLMKSPNFPTPKATMVKNYRHQRVAERCSTLPSRLKGPETFSHLCSNPGKPKKSKEIYSQPSAKAASNMYRTQTFNDYVYDPFDFDQSESDEQFIPDGCSGENMRKQGVNAQNFLI